MRIHTLKKLSILGLTVLCIFLVSPSHDNVYAEERVLIDNYDDPNKGTNTFGFWTGGNVNMSKYNFDPSGARF